MGGKSHRQRRSSTLLTAAWLGGSVFPGQVSGAAPGAPVDGPVPTLTLTALGGVDGLAVCSQRELTNSRRSVGGNS